MILLFPLIFHFTYLLVQSGPVKCFDIEIVKFVIREEKINTVEVFEMSVSECFRMSKELQVPVSPFSLKPDLQMDYSVPNFYNRLGSQLVKDQGFLGRNHRTLVLLNFKPTATLDRFEHFFSAPFKWLIFIHPSDVVYLDKLGIRQSSNVILAFHKTDSFELKQVYKVKNYTSLIPENYGIFVRNKFTDQRSSKVLSRRRINFHGEEVVGSVVILSNKSLNHMYDQRHLSFDSAALRANFMQMDSLLDKFNGSKKFIFTPQFGYDETGIWVGNAGNMVLEHADVPIAPFFVTPTRLHYLDFLGTISPTRIHFVFRAPPLSSVANLYTLPFSKGVWISFGVLLALLSASVFVLFRSQSEILSEEKTHVTDVLLMAVAIVCQMGVMIEARLNASRIITLFFFLSFVFFYTSFTASIVGILQSTSKGIRTLTDLYHSNLEMGASDTPYNRYYIGRTTDPIRLKIYQEKLAPNKAKPNFLSLEDGIAKVRKGMFAFFAESSPAFDQIEDTFFEHEKCGLQQLEYLEIPEPYQAMRKNSPLKEIVKVKLQELGLTNAATGRFYRKKPLCSAGNQHFESVTFRDSFGATVILGVGTLLALLQFMMEKLHKTANNLLKKSVDSTVTARKL